MKKIQISSHIIALGLFSLANPSLQASRMNEVPTEVKQHILSFLNNSEVKKDRLIAKDFAKAGKQELEKRVCPSLIRGDIQSNGNLSNATSGQVPALTGAGQTLNVQGVNYTILTAGGEYTGTFDHFINSNNLYPLTPMPHEEYIAAEPQAYECYYVAFNNNNEYVLLDLRKPSN
ncbi:MAG: hypothetical protein IBJ00_00780 [Alphaproteobacteria bacterium]|nr:hypothetical protein [Alphaproteobacteria bacterium]